MGYVYLLSRHSRTDVNEGHFCEKIINAWEIVD